MKTSFTSQTWSTLVSFAVFTAILLGTFSIQLKNASAGMDRWVGHEDHRLPNIRLVPLDCRYTMIDRFIDLQPVEEADVFIFGDSQMFARGATQEEMFSTQWLGTEPTVINFSFLGASYTNMASIIEELDRRNLKAPLSLTNINLTHYIKAIGYVKSDSLEDEPLIQKFRRFMAKLNQRVLLPENSGGLSSVFTNRFICSFRMRQAFANDSLRTPRYRKLLTEFRKVNLRDSYVNFDETDFFETVQEDIDKFENISERTIFITAPMAYDKFSLYEFDLGNLDRFSTAFEELCSNHPEIECHDILTSINNEGFVDLIHMNANGHAKLGQILKDIIPPE